MTYSGGRWPCSAAAVPHQLHQDQQVRTSWACSLQPWSTTPDPPWHCLQTKGGQQQCFDEKTSSSNRKGNTLRKDTKVGHLRSSPVYARYRVWPSGTNIMCAAAQCLLPLDSPCVSNKDLQAAPRCHQQADPLQPCCPGICAPATCATLMVHQEMVCFHCKQPLTMCDDRECASWFQHNRVDV